MDFKCPNCDAAINWDSTSQQMKCPFCLSTFDAAALQAMDEPLGDSDIDWGSHDNTEWSEGEQEGMRLFSCNSCAGEIVADASTAATSCPFCGNPVVFKGQLSGSIRPDCIIPFKLDKKAAIDALSKHLSGKRLLPRCFKSQKQLNEIKGLYVPFWLFDAEVSADMRYNATTVRRWSDANFNHTETKHFNVVRKGDLAFDNVPVNASAKMPADILESIEPYDAKAVVPFQTAFLAGFLADKFDFCEEHASKRANARIEESTEVAFRRTVTGYATVTAKHGNVTLNSSKVQYALLPVWVLNATWRNQNYMFAMNGQSGKFVGNLPVDWNIFWRQFGIITVVITIVLVAIAALLGVGA